MAEANQGITRRQALKRGLVIGTGVLWATPVIQGIRMSEAYAQVTSSGTGTQPPGDEVGGGGITNPPGNGGPGNGGPGNGGPGNGQQPGNGQSPTPDEVGGKVIFPQPEAGTPITEVEAETLPLTGINVLPLAATGAGLMAAGAASLQIANQMEGSGGAAEESVSDPDDESGG